MSSNETAESCEALPPDKRWEAILADPEARPRLDTFLRESGAEADEALDLKRL